MKYKIVVDSSADLTKDYLNKEKEIGFGVIPLTIRVGDKEYVDDSSLDIATMLDDMKAFSGKSTSACPSPGSFLEEFDGEEFTICITITSKLSGTYNSACLAQKMAEEQGKKVYVIDSRGTSGMMALLVDKAVKLIKQNKSFEEVVSSLEAYNKGRNLLFVLQSFDNLIKNGRMKKLTALIASVLNIKPLCIASDGDIKIFEKIRSAKASLNRLTDVVGITNPNTEGETCIISHCYAEEEAKFVEEKLKEKYSFKEIIVRKMRGLCSFYALKKGVIVCF